MSDVSGQIGEGGPLDGPDADTDPGVVAAQGLDYFALVLADPERGLGDGLVVDSEGFGPELAFELEEAALVAPEDQAVDEEGSELRVGDVRRLLQRLMVEARFDVFRQAVRAGVEVVAGGVL
ncbi:hypothetical protein [Paludibaculum fermentans]|uniref:Uncharacterized protein n=1 Tax=Paludibaculum fermentans TaxID=1473598 RepID=A0A7S7NLX7_PALFE|nr:hypothetical protein [Paludibaculum fermentans]QOY85544.1 hypothetical protein IRI77_22260 [Paludibaculum fermentans]